mgnify:CR=1 FL=1
MTENKNPFLKPYNTPHDTAPFHLIKIEHYEPALLEGMKEQNEGCYRVLKMDFYFQS